MSDKSMEELLEEYTELQERYENHEVTTLREDTQSLRTCLEILRRNVDRQKEVKEYFEENYLELWNDGLAGHAVNDEYFRMTVNSLSSAYLLYEQTQTIKNRWASDELKKRYTKELDKRNLVARFTFIKEFRNLITHKRLRQPPMSLSLSEEEIEPSLDFEKEKVVSDDRLSEEAKDYVNENYDERIPMTEILEEHYKHINQFTLWFIQSLHEEYKESKKERSEIRKKMTKIEEEIRDRR